MLFRPLTLQEANAFLPFVKEGFRNIHALIAKGQSLHSNHVEQAASRPAVNGSVEATEDGPENRLSPEIKKRIREIELTIRDEVLGLQQYGAFVRSVYPPKVEFLAERHRQPVYLSWQLGDEKISHWHPIEESFSTRRVVTKPDSFGPFIVH